MSEFKRGHSWAAFALLLVACGDDAPSREEDAASEREDAATTSSDGGRRDGSVASSDATTQDAGARSDGGGAPVEDASAATSDAATSDAGARGEPDPSMVTSGPVEVSGTLKVNASLSINFVSGLAYYDPTNRLGAADPALKVVLTDWPVAACDPSAIARMKAEANGKHYIVCELYEGRSALPYPLLLKEGNKLGFLSVEGEGSNAGCMADITQGAGTGGEQFIGSIRVRPPDDEASTRATISARVNHCGVIDTTGNI